MRRGGQGKLRSASRRGGREALLYGEREEGGGLKGYFFFWEKKREGKRGEERCVSFPSAGRKKGGRKNRGPLQKKGKKIQKGFPYLSLSEEKKREKDTLYSCDRKRRQYGKRRILSSNIAARKKRKDPLSPTREKNKGEGEEKEIERGGERKSPFSSRRRVEKGRKGLYSFLGKRRSLIFPPV